MRLNPDRLLCGVATIFEKPSPNDSRSWSADDFADFLQLEIAVPLLVDHGPIYNTWGVTDKIGTARRFAPITQPVCGLLALAEVDYADGWGDSVLDDIRSILSQRWLPAAWGMSIGAWVKEGGALPYELSLSRTPAYDSALVLAAGPQALTTWEFLTGSPYTHPNIKPRPRPGTADRW